MVERWEEGGYAHMRERRVCESRRYRCPRILAFQQGSLSTPRKRNPFRRVFFYVFFKFNKRAPPAPQPHLNPGELYVGPRSTWRTQNTSAVNPCTPPWLGSGGPVASMSFGWLHSRIWPKGWPRPRPPAARLCVLVREGRYIPSAIGPPSVGGTRAVDARPSPKKRKQERETIGPH